jgi:drug/metabolite transporter (DMT)-like permease
MLPDRGGGTQDGAGRRLDRHADGHGRCAVTSSPKAPSDTLSPAAVLAANKRGIIAMVLAMAFFVTNDSFMKLAREDLPAGQVMAIRGAFGVLFTLGLVIAMGELGRIRLVLRRIVVVRAALELAVAVCFIIALGHLPLADITAMGQSAPLLIAAYLALRGQEQMGWRRWSAVVIGFAGVLLVVKPGGPGFTIYAVLGLMSAVLVAARDLVTRFVPREVPTVLILATTTGLVALGGGAMGLAEEWQTPSAAVVAHLALAGLFVTLGHYCVISAFRDVEIAVVSPFRYSVVLFAVIYGIVIFGHVPDALAMAGTLLIVMSGLYTLHRERIRRRDIAAAAMKNPPAA